MSTQFDTILYVNDNNHILETDNRIFATKPISGETKSFYGVSTMVDPKLYSGYSFGKQLRSELSGMGPGSFAKVTDFGKWVTVEAGWTDIITGRSDSKTFLIIFHKDNGDGLIMNTANKYRSISGVSQAASYIKSACNTLRNQSNNKI